MMDCLPLEWTKTKAANRMHNTSRQNQHWPERRKEGVAGEGGGERGAEGGGGEGR